MCFSFLVLLYSNWTNEDGPVDMLNMFRLFGCLSINYFLKDLYICFGWTAYFLTVKRQCIHSFFHATMRPFSVTWSRQTLPEWGSTRLKYLPSLCRISCSSAFIRWPPSLLGGQEIGGTEVFVCLCLGEPGLLLGCWNRSQTGGCGLAPITWLSMGSLALLASGPSWLEMLVRARLLCFPSLLVWTVFLLRDWTNDLLLY